MIPVTPSRLPDKSRVFYFILGHVLVILGTYLFAKGFMTSKPVSEVKSFPQDNAMLNLWPQPEQKKKFVVLVVDALRIDFALPQKKSSSSKFAYGDRLKILYELARSSPDNAKLFKFIADPPTATTQRLGGITAGTLPSFVEAFENFAGETLLADNFVFQLVNNKNYKNMHFMGDDTWIHLYPFMLEKSTGKIKGYHSFHLFDLHTVDNGIQEQLFPALQENNFDVIIAHFLGLDHCGHKFGPLHEDCGKKLDEMDTVIRKVIDSLDDDTTLIVFGDHGMTDEGDHGGNAPREVSSALFFYNKKSSSPLEAQLQKDLSSQFAELRAGVASVDPFYEKDFDDSVLTGQVSQIDFAATLSVLANIPIPFGNLGALIPDLFFNIFNSQAETLKFMAEALKYNAHQVLKHLRSLESYQQEFESFEVIIQAADHQSKIGASMIETGFLYYKYIQTTLSHCRFIWARYRFDLIYAGLGFILLGLVILLSKAIPRQFNAFEIISAITFITINCIGKATNSFIIHEADVTKYLLSSFLTIAVLFEQAPFIPTSVSMALIRVFGVFKACREEHGKHCQAFNHRTVHPCTRDGSMFVLCLIFGLISSSKSKNRVVMVGLLSFYQLYGWLHENYRLNESILQIYLPRFIWLFLGCAICYHIFNKPDKSSIIFCIFSLVSTFQRPFGGWLVLNGGSFIMDTLQRLNLNSMNMALIIYCSGMGMFFWTGHHAVISNVHWEAAFTGFTELNQVRASIFLGLNTFSGFIISALIALCLDKSYGLFYIFASLAVTELLFESFFIIFLLRHLMLWTVFTPRFIMQAAIPAINMVIFVIFYAVSR